MKQVFVSHTTLNDTIVAELRRALERSGLRVWVDSRELTGGGILQVEISSAIDDSTHLIAVLSPEAINSTWMQTEIQYARQAKNKVVPILLDGIQPAAVKLFVGEEQVAIKIASGPGGVTAALPALLAALGEALPADAAPQAQAQPEAVPIADLTLELTTPQMVTLAGGARRAQAQAQLIYDPADDSREVKSLRFTFTAPLGPIEAEELAWYLERYINWPAGVFRQRAGEVEKLIPAWGEKLYAAVDHEQARQPMEAWKTAADKERRFTIHVDQDGGDPEAATALLALPWELLRTGNSYLFQGARGIRVRRSLPNYQTQAALVTDPPIRILLVSPRPEEEGVGYIDHRVSARPLVEALQPLGDDLAHFRLLDPPTFGAMEEELRRALKAGQPYHVVHFDGHGVYDRKHGLGALCFEHPEDSGKSRQRRAEIVTADKIAAVIKDHRVPLFFLEACQSAQAEMDPAASVAGQLLQSGVASVAAMSHSVLVETARRFVAKFYPALLSGARVGEAMLAGQRELSLNTSRGRTFAGELHMQDWFVPVLFQEQADPQLIRKLHAPDAQRVLKDHQAAALRSLPDTPGHSFVGRSRELLTAERLLAHERYVVLLGEGGEGKTTLAVELARWLVATRRFARAAFVALDQDGDARKLLYALGGGLVNDFVSQAALKGDWAVLEGALQDEPTLLVIDNVESVVDDPEVIALCAKLAPLAKLVFTSREALPEPFAKNTTRVGRLDRADAIRLVGKVLGEGKLMPHTGEAGESEEEMEALVDAVGCHARALVLLAGEVAATGVRAATADIGELMRRLEAQHPGERERSLLASVELSLKRLPPGVRERLRPLGVFHAGGSAGAIGLALGLEAEEVGPLIGALVQVGLATVLGHSYVRFDPALPVALLGELSLDEQESARAAWAEAMAALLGFLYQQRSKDANLALNLARLELPNLLAALECHSQRAAPERVVDLATRLEGLIAPLGRPKALAQAERLRQQAAGGLSGWSHAAFDAARTEIERWLEAGRFPQAIAAGRALWQKALSAGEAAYPEAAYDLAGVEFTLGQVLNMAGDPAQALALQQDARARFERLGNARMANAALTEQADCLAGLGRLDEAAATYEESIAAAEQLEDPRGVAVGKGQLATVRMRQEKYPEALQLYHEVKAIFAQLEEPGSVATAWHLLGMVHQRAKQFEAAEAAYQKSCALWAQLADASHEAATLGQLGNLYAAQNRLEDAVRFYRQAADRFVQLQDVAKEGLTRSNVADKLIRLERYEEARRELLRAFECKQSYGHAALPWMTFDILHDLERAEGHTAAAMTARRQARGAYLAYRRDGGESTTPAYRYSALVAQQPDAAREALHALRQDPDLPPYLVALLPALEAVLAGSRDPALADNPDIDFDDAAELLLVIEALNARAADV